MTGKRLVLLIAFVGFLYAYEYALVWGIGHASALPIPSGWRNSFPSPLAGILTWMIVVNTLAVMLVAVPFALLLTRFGGRRAPLVALAMTAAIFILFSLLPLIEFFGTMTTRMKLVTAFDQVKLIFMLPLLVWLFSKLPSSNRWRGP